MNGAWASLARRREISVLPTPVGPIMIIFFGAISSRRSSGTYWRRQRLRNAMATARLASFWPTMYRSSSETISRGVITGAALRLSRPEQQYSVSFMGKFTPNKFLRKCNLFAARKALQRSSTSRLRACSMKIRFVGADRRHALREI